MVANETTKTPRSNITDGMDQSSGIRLNPQRHKLKHKFDITRKLGQGTYGKVQLGVNKETGQEVAIKTIKKAKIETEQDLVRIRREIQIMSSVRHPNIIHIYEVFENRERIVLVMEFAAGGELYDYLSERKVLSEIEARRIFRQIAASIYYCHKHKICHRDLKLENILLDEFGNAKIADFGLSNVFDNKRFLNTFCGSPLYASPEIVKGTPYYGPEVDCWSLGVLLYTLVYGAMPFDGSNFKRLVKQISNGDYYEPKKTSPASELIRHMLTVSPLKRANIEDICSHWWVNDGYGESCLEIAEDLANQTPVRLDLLLQLAPPPNKEDLVIGKDSQLPPKEEVNESLLKETSSIADSAGCDNGTDIEIADIACNDVSTTNKRKLLDSPLEGVEPSSKEKCKNHKVELVEGYNSVPTVSGATLGETSGKLESDIQDIPMINTKTEVADQQEIVFDPNDTMPKTPKETTEGNDKSDELNASRPSDEIEKVEDGVQGEEGSRKSPVKSIDKSSEKENSMKSSREAKTKKPKSVKSKTYSSVPKSDTAQETSGVALSVDAKEKSPIKIKKERRNSTVSQVAQKFSTTPQSACPAAPSKTGDKPRKLLLTALKVNEAKRAFENKVADKKAVVIPGLKVSDARKAFEDKNSESKDGPSSNGPSRRGSKASDIPLLKTDITGRKVSLEHTPINRRDSKSCSITPTEEHATPIACVSDKSQASPTPTAVDSKESNTAHSSKDGHSQNSPVAPATPLHKREHLNSLNKDLDEMVSVLQAVDDIIKCDPNFSELTDEGREDAGENKNIDKIVNELRNKGPKSIPEQLKHLAPSFSCSSGSVSDSHTLTPDHSVPASPIVEDKPRKTVLIECAPNVTKVASMAGYSKKDCSSGDISSGSNASHSKTLPRGFRHVKSMTPEPNRSSDFAGTENSFLRKISETPRDSVSKIKRLSSCLEDEKTFRPTHIRGSSLEPKKSEVEFYISNMKPPTPGVTAKVTSIKSPSRDAEKKTQRTEVVFPVNKSSNERVSHSVEKVIPINLDSGNVSAPVVNSPKVVPQDKSGDRKSQGKEFIIPIALEGGGYAATSSTTPSTPSTPKSEQPDWVKNLEARLRERGPNMRFTRAKRLGNMFCENGSEDESGGSSVASPFGSLQRYSSFGKRVPMGQPKERESGSRMLNRYRSRVEHSDSFSSAGEEDDDDDDGFEILTAESLFSTLLARVRSLTRRLNQDTPTSSLRRGKYPSQDGGFTTSYSYRRQESDPRSPERKSSSFGEDDPFSGLAKPNVSYSFSSNTAGNLETMKTDVPATSSPGGGEGGRWLSPNNSLREDLKDKSPASGLLSTRQLSDRIPAREDKKMASYRRSLSNTLTERALAKNKSLPRYGRSYTSNYNDTNIAQQFTPAENVDDSSTKPRTYRAYSRTSSREYSPEPESSSPAAIVKPRRPHSMFGDSLDRLPHDVISHSASSSDPQWTKDRGYACSSKKNLYPSSWDDKPNDKDSKYEHFRQSSLDSNIVGPVSKSGDIQARGRESSTESSVSARERIAQVLKPHLDVRAPKVSKELTGLVDLGVSNGLKGYRSLGSSSGPIYPKINSAYATHLDHLGNVPTVDSSIKNIRPNIEKLSSGLLSDYSNHFDNPDSIDSGSVSSEPHDMEGFHEEDDCESVSDRILRKSYFSRFNEPFLRTRSRRRSRDIVNLSAERLTGVSHDYSQLNEDLHLKGAKSSPNIAQRNLRKV